MAEVAVRSRRDAIGNPYAQVQGDGDVDDAARRRLRARAAPPPRPAADHRRCRGDGARHRRPRPRARRAPGVHHRLRPPHRVPQPVVPRPRRLAVDPHRGRGGRPRRRAGRGRRAAGRVHPRGAAAAPGARARRRRRGQPVGWRAGVEPDHGHRPGPHRLRRRPRLRRRRPGARPLDVGTVPAAEPVCILEGRSRERRAAVCDRRRRPDAPQVAPPRRVVRRPRPRGRVPRARRRRT